jgi:drug/metabolite transporter (DMT)-like permease
MSAVSTGSPKDSKSQLAGWLILIVPPLFWAGNFVVGRASRGDVPPMLLAFSRHFLALLCLLPFGWSAMKRDLHRY